MSFKRALTLMLATVLWLGGCATRAPTTGPQDDPAVSEEAVPAEGPDRPGEVVIGRGLASWYGEPFHGRRTASGEIFDMNELTAAHKTLPFGTRVRVRHVRTGKEVTVRINDRGPHIAGRVIDLSRAAAAALGIVGSGIGAVVMLRDGSGPPGTD